MTDFTRVREALGGETALCALARRAREAGMGLILDIVPTIWPQTPRITPGGATCSRMARTVRMPHASISTGSRQTRRCKARCWCPYSGHPYWETLARGELRVMRLVGGVGTDAASLRYFEHDFPLAPDSLLRHAAADPAWFDATHDAGRERLHALLERSTTGWPGGARPRPRSTGGASLRSATWSACARKTPRYSTPRTRLSSACCARA
ncbi:hypothetical protein AWV80_22750 [Cupriavidus sp. UYMU48A]|nr:hypothetical protein AWV80_22750 [Cupriavidus sp. UYMU48A]